MATCTSFPTRPSHCSGADKLDHRLFDVTGLIEMGYDDAGTGTVPVIATYTRAQTRAVTTPVAPRGSRLGARAALHRRSVADRGQAAGAHVLDLGRAAARPDRPDPQPAQRRRQAVARRPRGGQPQGERPADRGARGLGGRVRRRRGQGRGARHRHRRPPPRPVHPDRRARRASSPRRASPTSTGTAPTSPRRSSAPAPRPTATTAASPPAPT